MADPKPEILSRVDSTVTHRDAPSTTLTRVSDDHGNALILNEAADSATVYAKNRGQLATQCKLDYRDTYNTLATLPAPKDSALAEIWFAWSGTLYSDVIAPPQFIPNLCKKTGGQEK